MAPSVKDSEAGELSDPRGLLIMNRFSQSLPVARLVVFQRQRSLAPTQNRESTYNGFMNWMPIAPQEQFESEGEAYAS